MYFVLPCTSTLTVFVQLYFVLRPHILGSVLLKLCGCFSPYNVQLFSRCFIRRRSHLRVEFFDLASHRFQFGFACAAFPFYFSSSLELFSLFFIHNNTVKSCFQGYVLSSPKTLYFFLEKKAVNTVSGLFCNQISFCCRLFTRAKIPMPRAWGPRLMHIYKLDVRLDSHGFPVIRD